MKDTKQLLLRKALELFKSEGFDNISIDRICKECNVTKGAFYHHFKSKEHLLFQYLDTVVPRHFQLMMDMIDIDDPKEQIWHLFTDITQYWLILGPELVSQIWIYVVKNDNSTDVPFIFDTDACKDMILLFKKLTQICIDKQIVHSCDDSDVLVHSIMTQAFGLSVRWASSKGSFDFLKELRKSFDLIYR